MKLITAIIGTKLEAIQLAPIIMELKKNTQLRYAVILTGQDNGLIGEILREFNIPLDIKLSVFQAGQNSTQFAGRLIEKLGSIFTTLVPAATIIQENFPAALASFYNNPKAPVFNIGTALSSDQEAKNKTLTAHLARLTFTPCLLTKAALQNAGVPKDKIIHLPENDEKTAHIVKKITSSLLAAPYPTTSLHEVYAPARPG